MTTRTLFITAIDINATGSMASQLETMPSVQSSQAEVWYLKNILFGPPGEEKKEYNIITQNFNGYVFHICVSPFVLTPYLSIDLARLLLYVSPICIQSKETDENVCIGNILILRDNITILPPERRTVSYEFLSQLVAEYLLNTSPDVDISSALEIMPYTQSECAFRVFTVSVDLQDLQREWI